LCQNPACRCLTAASGVLFMRRYQGFAQPLGHSTFGIAPQGAGQQPLCNSGIPNNLHEFMKFGWGGGFPSNALWSCFFSPPPLIPSPSFVQKGPGPDHPGAGRVPGPAAHRPPHARCPDVRPRRLQAPGPHRRRRRTVWPAPPPSYYPAILTRLLTIMISDKYSDRPAFLHHVHVPSFHFASCILNLHHISLSLHSHF